ncbi:MAG: adenosylcobinamide-GDP ribazoletransferase [Acidimicrobiia bacterium]
MRGFLGAVGFLTRIPVTVGRADLSVKWFPIVGLAIGVPSGLAYWAVSGPLGSQMAAVVAVALAVAITGAFHEDGLADTFDGLSSIRSRERQLEIMKDSRLGTFGVSALVLVLLARVVLVARLPGVGETVGTLAWAHGVSRSVVIGVMCIATPAAVDGSGVAYLSELRRGPALVLAVAVAAAGWLIVGERALLAVALAAVGSFVVWLWAHRRIGGVTGDVLGACQQVGLVGTLAALAA